MLDYKDVLALAESRKTEALLNRVIRRAIKLPEASLKNLVESRYRMILRILSETPEDLRSAELRDQIKHLVLGYREIRKK